MSAAHTSAYVVVGGCALCPAATKWPGQWGDELCAGTGQRGGSRGTGSESGGGGIYSLELLSGACLVLHDRRCAIPVEEVAVGRGGQLRRGGVAAHVLAARPVPAARGEGFGRVAAPVE